MIVEDENGAVCLKKYSWQTVSELFSTVALYIGLAMKEFQQNICGIPQWCFDDLHLTCLKEDNPRISKEDAEKARAYFKSEVLRVSQLFLDFVSSDEKQEDVDAMFDELKKIFLSLWK